MLALSFAIALFVGALFSLTVGIGLIVKTPSLLRLFERVNRWVSTRRALKPLEVPRGGVAIAASDGRRRRAAGAIFVAGGLYAAFVLATKVDPGRVVWTFGLSGPAADLAGILVQALVLTLIVGCAAAVIAGILLAGFPTAWTTIEARANRWYSTRQIALKGDKMHLTLDHWVERFPRFAGAVIVALSMIPLVTSSVLLFARR